MNDPTPAEQAAATLLWKLDNAKRGPAPADSPDPEDMDSTFRAEARAVVAAVRAHLETPLHDGVHHYLSTGCLHGDQVLPDGSTGHDYCKGMTGMNGAKRGSRCKFCDAKCRCGCHQDQGSYRG